MPVEQLAQLALGQKQAVGLVIGAVDRHADVVEQRSRRDDDLRVALAHRVVADHRRPHAALDEQAQQPQRDVEDDLDVDPGVIGHLQALGLHLGHVPPSAHLGVVVEPVEQRLEPAVAASRRRDLGPRGRLGGLAAEFAGARRGLAGNRIFAVAVGPGSHPLATLLWPSWPARGGEAHMPPDRAHGSGMQLPGLPRNDAARVPAGVARRGDQGDAAEGLERRGTGYRRTAPRRLTAPR